MPAEFRIDPTLGDYTLTAEGRPELTNDLTQAAYILLRTRLGEWMHDVALGSRYGELERVKLTPEIDRSIEDFAREALAPLLADGRARRFTVRTVERVRGGRRIEVQIVDRRERLLTPLELIIPVG